MPKYFTTCNFSSNRLKNTDTFDVLKDRNLDFFALITIQLCSHYVQYLANCMQV